MERVKEVRDFQEVPPEKYEGIDLNRLAVYGIFLLLESAIPVTFENLVVALYRMFPKKFCIEGFEEYPDAARVNRALLQLRPKYRDWARGSVHTGFTLTETGKAVVRQTKELLEGGVPHLPARRTPRPRTRDLSKDLAEITESGLFRAYSTGRLDSVPQRLVYDLLHAFPYTPRKVLIKRMNELVQMAKQCHRDEIVRFLQWVESSYPTLFKDVPHG